MHSHKTPKVRPSKLSSTLALSTLCISALTLVVISSIGMYFTYLSQRQAVGSSQALVAQNAASGVRSFVQDKISALDSSVKFNYLTGIPSTNTTSALEKLLSLEPAFNQAVLLDTQQHEVSYASRIPDLYAGSITSQVDKSQLFQAVKQNKDYISQVYIDKTSNEPEVLIAVPINSIYTGFSGTLVAETDLKFMWNLVGNIKDGAHGLAYVVDEHGELIAAGDTTRVLKQENLSNLSDVKQFLNSHSSAIDSHPDDSIGFNGTKVVSTYAALGTPNWAVVTEIPVSEAYAPVMRSIIISSVLILIGVAVSIIASVLFARRITQPLITLRDIVDRFGQGELGVKVDIVSNNEIGELGKAFNAMATNLQTSAAKLHEEHAKLEASISSLDVGFLMIDLEGNVVVNPAARNILAYRKDDKGQQFDPNESLSLDNIEARLGSTIRLKANIDEALKTLQPIERKAVDFKSRVLSIFIAPILSVSGNSTTTLGTVVLLEDITEEQILDRSKDEFFSIASHELRTPLTSIKGNTSMIMQYYPDVMKDNSLHEMINDIHSSSIRLIEVVNDFLDVSRLEQSKISFNYETLGIEEVIESVAYEMRSVLKEKKLYLKLDKITLDHLPKVWADKNRLKQVIYNLLGNASKFTDVGGITLNAEVDKDMVKVMVSDTGRGMTMESQRLLFHKFQQASSSLLTRDTTRGTGLGLYISKMLVENMGGKINLEKSVEGEGTTFSFTIPITTQARQNATARVIALTDTTTGISSTK